MSRGNITRRGKNSWRLKFDIGRDEAGNRITRLVTVRGKRQDAERELTKLLQAADAGTLVEPSKVTVKEYIDGWLAGGGDGLAGKTRERYRQLADQQISPHLGAVLLQKLRPAQVQAWHDTLAKSGGKGGRPLSARTVGHAHRVLRRALARAAKLEIITRNVAALMAPPKVEEAEIVILTAEQMASIVGKLDGHALQAIAAIALATGMRRGELCALAWGCVDLDASTVRVERSLEETKEGLCFKGPKSKNGRRLIALPPSAVEMLRGHRRRQLEQRLALGLGRLDGDALVFGQPDGSPRSPDNLSRDWRRCARALKLPLVMFHALRHSHASALIASGLDVMTISRRLGHGSASFTLRVYGHLFSNTDAAAARAIEAAMGTGVKR